MSTLEDVRPTRLDSLYDLLEEVGFDVSDWNNYNGSNKKANPRYCYKWSFLNPRRLVLLCIWYENMKVEDGVIFQDRNVRQLAQVLSPPSNGRAIQMDHDIRVAFTTGLPVRAIICDKKQNLPTRATKRILDSLPWHIAAYDESTGDCRLVRGGQTPKFVDQFLIQDEEMARRRDRSGTEIVRNNEVKQRALHRAQGKCEYCGNDGFLTANGQLYLETHHIIPLAENGPDTESNVVALCPNHHRQAHHGSDREMIKGKLLQYLQMQLS